MFFFWLLQFFFHTFIEILAWNWSLSYINVDVYEWKNFSFFFLLSPTHLFLMINCHFYFLVANQFTGKQIDWKQNGHSLTLNNHVDRWWWFLFCFWIQIIYPSHIVVYLFLFKKKIFFNQSIKGTKIKKRNEIVSIDDHDHDGKVNQIKNN